MLCPHFLQAEGSGLLIQPEYLGLHKAMWARTARALSRSTPAIQQPAAAARAAASAGLAPLTQQPPYVSGPPLAPNQLEGLNWLRGMWAKGQHAILADEPVGSASLAKIGASNRMLCI
jgi:hypothetical protein